VLADVGAVTVGGGTFNIATFSDTVGAVTLTSGSITGTGGTLTGSSYDVRSGTISAQLGGSGVALTKSTTGTVTLSGVNTYSGGTTVNAGTLQASGSGTFGASSGSLTVNAGTADLNDTNQSVGALAGSGGTILNNGSTTKTLTVGNGNATGGSYAGVIADHNNGGTGILALTKVGTGTQTLTGTNTYTGATTVTGGTLEIANDGSTTAGRLSNTSAIVVNSGGTLRLSGAGSADRINNSAGITLAGGTLAKGADVNEGSTSTIGLGALTLTANSTLDYTGTAGTLTFASFAPSSFNLSIVNYFGTGSPSGTSQLIFNQDQSGNLNNFNFGFGAGVNVAEFSLGSGFWEVYSTAPVPEPGTWAGAALALATMLYTQRRRIVRKAKKLKS
jgi:fibronectin-binding autotransporter adhesin